MKEEKDIELDDIIDMSRYKPPFRSEIYYLDDDNNIVDYENATKFISKDSDENHKME